MTHKDAGQAGSGEQQNWLPTSGEITLAAQDSCDRNDPPTPMIYRNGFRDGANWLYDSYLTRLSAENATLREQRDAMAKDAERYRMRRQIFIDDFDYNHNAATDKDRESWGAMFDANTDSALSLYRKGP